MLYRWLPNDEVCNVPKYAHTFLGVGAFVFNKDTNEVLVIKEKYASNKTWKLPGGYVEPGIFIETVMFFNFIVIYIYVYIHICI